MVNRLLEEDGGYLNAQARNGLSPLIVAALVGRDAVLARLIELGADVDLREIMMD